MRFLHIVRHRTAASAKCILGFSGCKYTRATSDACSVKRRDRARIKNTSGFYDSTRLMRASNWNSARATTDDVSRVHEHTSTHKYANCETAMEPPLANVSSMLPVLTTRSYFETSVWENQTSECSGCWQPCEEEGVRCHWPEKNNEDGKFKMSPVRMTNGNNSLHNLNCVYICYSGHLFSQFMLNNEGFDWPDRAFDRAFCFCYHCFIGLSRGEIDAINRNIIGLYYMGFLNAVECSVHLHG